nr:unnamed protein product [Callosobruchus chinensis]
MLRDSAAAILENLSSSNLRDYSKITSALKLRFGDAHLTELLHGQLHNRTQQAKEDLNTFAYEVQSLAKRADTKNLRKKCEQHGGALRKLKVKHYTEVAALKI